MEIQEYFHQKKEFYYILLQFLEKSENSRNQMEPLTDFINKNILQDKNEFDLFLYLLLGICNNNHNFASFFNQVKRILLYYKKHITQTYSNTGIFNIFSSHKQILLFLFENDIILADEAIANEIIRNGTEFCHFFWPEIKKFLCKEKVQQFSEFDSNFDEKRRIGENDSYLCTLIRNDSIKEFVLYVNETNTSLSKKIEPSPFETNSFLIENTPALIEYAAFFGSIKIFIFLSEKVLLNPSLWLYVIHSKSSRLIHFLEESQIKPTKECVIEAIKCHHNDIVNYFINSEEIEIEIDDAKIYEMALHYHNYSFLPDDLMQGCVFFYLCKYNNSKLVDLFINARMNCLNMDDVLQKEINNKTLYKAATENNTEILYYLLSKKIKISKRTFKGNNSLTQICIPSSVTSIRNFAFNKCDSLREVLIPSSVVYIGDDAFSYCRSLIEITIPSSVATFGKRPFKGCESLKKVTILCRMKKITESFFRGCISLKQITIPSTVESIEKCAFSGCKSLALIDIPSSVNIEYEIFQNCSSLRKITLPSSMTKIPFFFFSGCRLLEQVSIPSSVTSIESHAFHNCASLKHISIPSSVTSIENYAFLGCASLKNISIPSSVKSIGNYAFGRCSALTRITIPSSIYIENLGFSKNVIINRI